MAQAALWPLSRSQGVLPRAHGATARRAQGALRPDLPAAHRVRDARPPPGTAARQQGGAADGAVAPRGAAAHRPARYRVTMGVLLVFVGILAPRGTRETPGR